MLHFYKRNERIGLDIDEVCAKFLEGYSALRGKDYTNIKHFNFTYSMFEKISDAPESFWLNLNACFDPLKLNFIPTCYISRRSIPTRLTEEWLEKNHFPCMPVIHVTDSKVDACKKLNVDYYVDDYILNFQELNSNSITTFLMDCTNNRQYDVDPMRLMNINNLPQKIMDFVNKH